MEIVKERAIGEEKERAIGEVKERAIGEEKEIAIGEVKERAIGEEKEIAIGEVKERAIGEEKEIAIGEVKERAIGEEKEIAIGEVKERAIGQEKEIAIGEERAIGEDKRTTQSVQDAGFVCSGGVADSGSSSSDDTDDELMLPCLRKLLDKSAPHVLWRWMGFMALVFIYAFRIYLVGGFYFVSLGLGVIFVSQLFKFLTPKVDPAMPDFLDEGPTLPSLASDEFRPFERLLPEFIFWYNITKAFCIGFLLTFIFFLDLPTHWPLLVLFWIIVFIHCMEDRIEHMIKYNYIPFSFGKQRYDYKRTSSRG